MDKEVALYPGPLVIFNVSRENSGNVENMEGPG